MSDSESQRRGRRGRFGRPPGGESDGLTYRDLQRAVLLAFGLFLFYQLAEPLTTLFLFFLLVFILAAVLNPVVSWLNGFGIPRAVAAIVLVVLFLGAVALLAMQALPPLLREFGTFLDKLDTWQRWMIDRYRELRAQYPELEDQLPAASVVFENVTPSVTSMLGYLGRYTFNVAVGVLSLILLLVLVVFTVSRPAPLLAGFLSAVPARYRERVEAALRRILTQLKHWAFGSIALGLIVGVMTGLGLWILGLATGRPFPQVMLFSVIAGAGEMVPTLGPILSALPPAIVALTIDPWLALWVILLFVVIQQLENNLIVPLVMGQSLNLHPVSVTFTVLVMGALFGLLGAVLAVPVCAIVKVCWEEFYLIPRRTDMTAMLAVARSITGDARPPVRPEAAEKAPASPGVAAGGTEGALPDE